MIQKKRQQTSPNRHSIQPESADLIAKIDGEIDKVLGPEKLRYAWMIPVMVVMVVGATIYLAVLERKTEYVYSLATACFGYYFGSAMARPEKTLLEPQRPMNGVNDLTE